ncbi:hypothetical protein H8B13_18975 [Hymenobacter sp. BT188]|uniref:hypothetical protein n=1 Tax=Hymenobacter sp. BT188 TaxID=2763504 RepID=UPI0016514709|nr:hypothetical protein [Hymenobacter sp. BT188]MBC6608912.1 hypothetical protein [Hymenobacter sp. BT188]
MPYHPPRSPRRTLPRALLASGAAGAFLAGVLVPPFSRYVNIIIFPLYQEFFYGRLRESVFFTGFAIVISLLLFYSMWTMSKYLFRPA